MALNFNNNMRWGLLNTGSNMLWNDLNAVTNLLNNENNARREDKINKVVNNVEKRYDTRTKINNWTITSWNKGNDKMELARSALSDYARVQYAKEAKKDKSMDLWVLDKMKDQDIIDWLIWWDKKNSQRYIDFVNNWGIVWEVYNDLMWIDLEAEKEAEKQNSSWGKNFVWSFINEIPQQLWWIMDLTHITDWLNYFKRKNLEKYNELNTDEYNNSFLQWKIPYWKKFWMYNDYKREVENGNFVWSVEDYAKVMYDKWMWETNKTFQQWLREESPINYNEEWKWTWAGKFAAQLWEFAAMPRFDSLLGNILAWSAEVLWINAASEWKLPSPWSIGVEVWLNSALEWVTRVPQLGTKIKQMLGNATPEVVEALGKTTTKQWQEFWDTVKQWFTATKKKATEILDKAAKWIKGKVDESWKNLEKIREGIEWDFSYQDYFDSINEQFKKFEDKWWGKNAAPEIKIWKDWKLEIYNEEALSNITDANWKKLTDFLKSEWDAFSYQWRAGNARDVETFMKNMSTKIYEAAKNWWIKTSDSATKAILEWTKDAYEKLYTKMWDKWAEFKKAREDFSNYKDYEEFFEKYIGNIKWGKESALKELEKTQRWEKSISKWWDTIWEFLNLLKSNNIVKDDIASELTSLLYAYALKNPTNLSKLIENIYPSIPWIYELWLSFWRKNLKESYAKSLLKDSEKSTVWSDIMDQVGNLGKAWLTQLPLN